MPMRCARAYLLLVLFAVVAINTPEAHAGGGPLGIDYALRYDNAGIWARHDQVALEYAVVGTEVAGALWLGNDDPLGHEFWQSIDSSAVSGVAAQLLKYAFSRARPYQNQGPNSWFQGSGHQSFPSGEVTLQAAFVTPIILDESAAGDRWIWALELLPLYDSIARLKVHDHWQTDVLAGWALGTASGYWSAQRAVPLSVEILPRGLSVGFRKKF